MFPPYASAFVFRVLFCFVDVDWRILVCHGGRGGRVRQTSDQCHVISQETRRSDHSSTQRPMGELHCGSTYRFYYYWFIMLCRDWMRAPAVGLAAGLLFQHVWKSGQSWGYVVKAEQGCSEILGSSFLATIAMVNAPTVLHLGYGGSGGFDKLHPHCCTGNVNTHFQRRSQELTWPTSRCRPLASYRCYL